VQRAAASPESSTSRLGNSSASIDTSAETLCSSSLPRSQGFPTDERWADGRRLRHGHHASSSAGSASCRRAAAASRRRAIIAGRTSAPSSLLPTNSHLTLTHTPPSHTSTQHHAVCPRSAHRPQGLRPALARRPDRLRHRRRPRHVSRPSRHRSPPNSFGRGHRVVPGLDPPSDAARARIAQAVVLRLAERAPSTACAISSARPRLDKPGPPC
jgi:hypothetical protein